MNRRRFFLLSTAGAIAAGFPFSGCETVNTVERPEFLQSLISSSQISEIGKAYLDTFPSEADRKKLLDLVQNPGNGQSESSIKLRIENEFSQGKIIILKGWILSITEARQSALFFLNS